MDGKIDRPMKRQIDGGEDRLIYEKIDRWMGRQIDL